MKKVLGLFLLASVSSIFSQDCNSILSDPGHLVKNRESVLKASDSLIKAGADVRIVLLPLLIEPTLDRVKDQFVSACPSWQASAGGMKNNLVILMVSMHPKKLGTWAGDQWTEQFKSVWPHIQSAIMKPRLRDGDIDGALIAGINEIQRVITTPVVPGMVIVQSSPAEDLDLKDLWQVLWWIVCLCTGIAGIVLFVKAYQRRKLEKALRQQAQTYAIAAQNIASKMVQEAETGLLSHDMEAYPDIKSRVTSAVSTFGSLGTGATDPTNNNLEASHYKEIAKIYSEVTHNIDSAQRALNDLKRKPMSGKPTEPPSGTVEAAAHIINEHHNRAYRRQHKFENQQPTVQHDTVVIHDTGYEPPIIVPVIVPEPYVPEPERYHDPTPSSWDSSSSSDSGGSSSYDSGSSDSGGSSDYGSSSDSGSGGSSDF